MCLLAKKERFSSECPSRASYLGHDVSIAHVQVIFLKLTVDTSDKSEPGRLRCVSQLYHFQALFHWKDQNVRQHQRFYISHIRQVNITELKYLLKLCLKWLALIYMQTQTNAWINHTQTHTYKPPLSQSTLTEETDKLTEWIDVVSLLRSLLQDLYMSCFLMSRKYYYYYKIKKSHIQCPPLILPPLVNMSKGSCENKSALFILFIFYSKFTKFQPIIEVKQLKVGRGISLWNKCFHYFMLATIIGTQLLQRPFPSTTALSFLL